MDEPGDLNGGFNHERTAPIGQAKQSKESYYGTEYVMMARYTIPATEKSPIGVGLDWGFLVPGKAIEDVLDVDAVMKMLWRVDVGW
jgi:hypothetical protein